MAGPGGPLNCNVDWFATDSLAACPAGDSVIVSGHPFFVHPHPSKLRVWVRYEDAACNVKAGVPPESIWVEIRRLTGNVKLTDVPNPINADDSTNVNGETRITVAGFSGQGKIRVTLFVSGVSYGYVDRIVRTTDGDADGRTKAISGDIVDINYDGAVDGWDDQIVVAHLDHWHRNLLHGTLVRRTNFCETCGEFEVGTKGEGLVAWSPTGKYVAYSAFVSDGGLGSACKIFIVPSDPKDGNASPQLTFTPAAAHDYDPTWSPLNTEIAFDRQDAQVLRRPVPWLGATESVVTSSANCGGTKGDTQPAISPDGRTIAFARCNSGGGWSLWKINVDGTGLANLTTASSQTTNFYPQWSPKGQTIYFQRRLSPTDPWELWKIPASGGTPVQVFATPTNSHAVQPAQSPDDSIMVSGFGQRDELVRKIFTSTLDLSLASPGTGNMLKNYPDTSFAAKGDFPILSPRLSPDGTRTLLGSKQVWAARRRMNLPPRITKVGTQSVVDSTARVFIIAARGLLTTVTVTSTDPELDPRTCSAFYLQDGMTFNPSTCTLSWTPSAPVGTVYRVKFRVTTASGGTDAILAEFTVVSPAPPPRFAVSGATGEPDGPNPTRGRFAITSPFIPGATAEMTLFDVSGRFVTTVRAPAGQRLVWEGRSSDGSLAPSGIYLWRMKVGPHDREGKVVVVR